MVRMLPCASNVTISASFATAAGAALSALAMASASEGAVVSTEAAYATKGAVQASNANINEARMTSLPWSDSAALGNQVSPAARQPNHECAPPTNVDRVKPITLTAQFRLNRNWQNYPCQARFAVQCRRPQYQSNA